MSGAQGVLVAAVRRRVAAWAAAAGPRAGVRFGGRRAVVAVVGGAGPGRVRLVAWPSGRGRGVVWVADVAWPDAVHGVDAEAVAGAVVAVWGRGGGGPVVVGVPVFVPVGWAAPRLL